MTLLCTAALPPLQGEGWVGVFRRQSRPTEKATPTRFADANRPPLSGGGQKMRYHSALLLR